MLDQGGKVLYVGKAKNLRKRVSTYFLNLAARDTKTRFLVSKINSIETLLTQTEEEALILERQLIQLYKPRYNIALKDDKNYPYIKITHEAFPKILVVRHRSSDKATYFGPYPSLGSTKQFLRFIHDLYPLRDCKQSIDTIKHQPKCIKLDLGKCLGPCVIKTIQPDYAQAIEELKLLLSGKNQSLISTLTHQMQTESHDKAYEKAAKTRDKLAKIQSLMQSPQRVQLDPTETFQVWIYAQNNTTHYALIQTFIEGKLLYQKGFYLHKQDLTQEAFLQEAIFHFSTLQEHRKPGYILCDSAMFDAFKPLYSSLAFSQKKSHIPQRGPKKQVLDLAQKNALFSLERLSIENSDKPAFIKTLLEKTKETLGTNRLPNRIMGVDISHLQGTDIVGSVVYFKEGSPDKSLYRHMKIRTVQGQSHDPLSIFEVVFRRLKRMIAEKETFPDLLLIDGGKGQLNFALKAMQELNLTDKISVISLAKREEEIFLPGRSESIKLGKEDPVLHLLQRVRDEAHRFAVTFQKTQRIKAFR